MRGGVKKKREKGTMGKMRGGKEKPWHARGGRREGRVDMKGREDLFDRSRYYVRHNGDGGRRSGAFRHMQGLVSTCDPVLTPGGNFSATDRFLLLIWP